MSLYPPVGGLGMDIHRGKGGRLAERRAVRQPKLTERELSVLRLLAKGRSNKEIGRSLGELSARWSSTSATC